ncbi:MAG TPA: N-6 DNA methylase [Roseiflexaceae bacterium]|nr:N-6 DNA methylase [Roseiflexaceae bacterium]
MSPAFVTAHRRAYGQFFTPERVVACCYQLLTGALPSAPRIVDPACGDGVFLRYAAANALTVAERLYGCDLDPALAATLATGGLTAVRHADGLDPAVLPDGAFDLVIGNPPYGVGGVRNGGTAPASEVRFLLRALDLARPSGYVALILPSGVLANQRLHGIRAGLLERHTLLAVIALPRETFRHTGTSAACSIVLLRNAPAPADHQVFFALPQQLENLPEIVAAYHARLQIAENPAESPVTRQPLHVGCQRLSFWFPQSAALARRLDAAFWRPEERVLLERMATRYRLATLGELIESRRSAGAGRHALIPGDHVRPSRGEVKGPGLPYEYYQTREFLPTGYNYAALEHCDERAYRRLRRTAVRQHDILVSCAGVGGAGRGRVCLITHSPGPSCTGDVLILRIEEPDPIFLYLFLISPAGRAQLLRLQNGVGTANLSADELLQVEVPLVARATQHDLARRYMPIAAAHDMAMAAAQRGDPPGFERELMWAQRALDELVSDIDALLLG